MTKTKDMPAQLLPALQKKAPRQSNLELLRIIMMLMIVAYHLRVYGLSKGDIAGAPMTGKIIIAILCTAGKVGVVGFVLISGYFMVNSKPHAQPMRLLKIYLQMFFYSVGGYFAFCALGWNTVDLQDAIRQFLPVTQQNFWFGATYFLLLLFSPFLNILIHHLDQKTYRSLLIISLIVFCGVPTLVTVRYTIGFLPLFIVYYLLAGYLRLHPPRWVENKWVGLGMAVGGYALLLLHPALYNAMDRWPAVQSYLPHNMSINNSAPVVLCALGLFLFFKNIHVKNNRAINLIASTTFGVYLLHDHSKPVRDYLWNKMFDTTEYFSRPWAMLLQYLVIIVLVFAVCSAIDLLRLYVLERPLFRLIDRIKAKRKAGEVPA